MLNAKTGEETLYLPFNIEIKEQDVATIANLLFGTLALLFMATSPTSNQEVAALLVLVCVLADGADGYLARARGRGILGAQLDSLADFVSFGLVPSVLAFYILRDTFGMPLLFFVIAFIYLVSSMVRLARYNVSPLSSIFAGLPITASGLVIALWVMAELPAVGLIVLLLLLAGVMLTDFRYPKISNNLTLLILGILMVLTITLYLVGNGSFRILAIVLLILSAIYALSPLFRR